jgi:predicted Rossmann-fold nucleotide-binding protein
VDDGESGGIRIDLPFEQNVNAFVSQAYEHRTFFTRLHQFVIPSDAFLVTPGGIGTVLEMTMIWQLLQVQHLQNVPLILVGKMWLGLIEWARASMLSTDPPLANPEDLTIPVCVADADQAITLIRNYQPHGLRLSNSYANPVARLRGGRPGEDADALSGGRAISCEGESCEMDRI